MELFFVNSIGFGFHSGTIIAAVILIAGLAFGLFYTRKRNWPIVNASILSLIFMLIGFSNYLMIAIRANTNTPINENSPSTAVTLLDYYNRVQYGEWPVLYGPMYTAYEGGLKLDEREPYLDGTPIYEADETSGKYLMVDDKKGSKYNIKNDHVGLFARMYSHDANHISMYKAIAGNPPMGKRPTLWQNIVYFMDYQVGYMYMRYFMWNFVGRQNDFQGKFEPTKGNWISGIGFIDEPRVGPQDNLPAKFGENKANNKYYFIPFLIGLIGLLFHFQNYPKDWYSLFLFFFMTGIAILIYTSPKPFEPRERDYAVVGSFYVFAIWIGIGAWSIIQKISQYTKPRLASIATVSILMLAVPGLLASENWDDHDRSERTTARDLAKMYLDSCDENAILFTYGDNDTFPLWYVQEVEGYRTDIKIVNLSLLNTDWYIDQMKQKTYKADPIPSIMTHNLYRQGTRDAIYFYDGYGISNKRWTAQQFIKWVSSDSDKTKVSFGQGGQKEVFYPTKKLSIPVNIENAIKYNLIDAADSTDVLESLDWDLKGNALEKKDIMIIDMIANFDWKRPIYFSVTAGYSSESFLYLDDYFQLEGLAYKLVPMKTKRDGIEIGKVATERMYQKVTSWDWGNFGNEDAYQDETNRRTASWSVRNNVARLANALIDEGQTEKAIEVIDELMKNYPTSIYYKNHFLLGSIEAYYKAGAADKARVILQEFIDDNAEEIRYYAGFNNNQKMAIERDIQIKFGEIQSLLQIAAMYDQDALSDNESKFRDLIRLFE
jgi:tetratricopeptide (TPR) repeat protein